MTTTPQAGASQPAKHFVSTGSYRLCYVEGGAADKPVAIFLHGWIASHQLYRRVWRELGEMFHFYALDLPGFGDSDKPDPATHGYDPAFYADAVAKFADAVGAKDFILVGQSMGGMVAVEFAIRAPERVRRLVLIDSAGIEIKPPLLGRILQAPGIGKPLFMALGGTKKALTDFLKNDVYARKTTFEPAVLDEMLAALNSPGGKAAAYAALTRMVAPTVYRRFMARFAEVKVPTQIIWGEQDHLFPLETCGRSVARLMPGAALHVVPGSGHEPPVEEPEAFMAALRAAVA